jgi:hypothetical protein
VSKAQSARECTQCGATFDPARPRQRYCASSCQIQAANQRRASTRDGRRAVAVKSNPTATEGPSAQIANLFGQWFLRVDGWLALGPMDQAKAQEHADRMNK